MNINQIDCNLSTYLFPQRLVISPVVVIILRGSQFLPISTTYKYFIEKKNNLNTEFSDQTFQDMMKEAGLLITVNQFFSQNW